MTAMTISRRSAAAAAAVAALVAMALPSSWVARTTDLVTAPATGVDQKVVVISFDERRADGGDGPPVDVGLTAIPDRRGIYLRDIATQADRAGAAAVIYVGFDSLSLYEGAVDRLAIAESEPIQRLGVAPLLEVAVTADPDAIPAASRYRVDELAGQFSGIGFPLVADGPVIRTTPAIVGVPTLEPGSSVHDGTRLPVTNLVYGLAVRGLAATMPGTSTGGASADAIEVAGRRIPLEVGRLRIRWTSALNDRNDPSVIDAEQFLAAATDVSDLDGKVVLVGSTDPAHTPYFDTPQGRMPEVLIQANALNTLFTNDYLRPVPAWIAPAASVLLAAVVALLWRRRWWLSVSVGLAGAVLAVTIASQLSERGWLVAPLRPVVATLSAICILGVAVLARQLEQRRRLSKLFSEYVPPDIARELISSGRAEAAQAGERLLVTVLFCDLRGFTPIAARLSPTDVRVLLDSYYEALSPLVFDNGGTVLQYTGDEIFAVFGAPVPRPDHAHAALRSALAMQAAAADLERTLHSRGLPGVSYGISLHSGTVVAAHVGSTVRRQYAVIGDTVNVGSRLCPLATAGHTVYSDSTRQYLDLDLPADELGSIRLKGISEPVTVFQAPSLDSEDQTLRHPRP